MVPLGVILVSGMLAIVAVPSVTVENPPPGPPGEEECSLDLGIILGNTVLWAWNCSPVHPIDCPDLGPQVEMKCDVD